MGGYRMPFPTRRRNVRTPPFTPGRSGPYGYPAQIPPPPQIPPDANPTATPQPGASPQAPSPDQRGFGRRVYDFLSNPDTGTYLAGVSQRLLAPRQFGETATSQIMGGLLGGYNDVAARRMMQYQTEMANREAQRKAGLEEREQTRKEVDTGSQSMRRAAQSQIEQRGATTAEATQAETARKNKAQEEQEREKLSAQVQEWHDKEQLERDKLVELERNNRERTKNYAERTAAQKVNKEGEQAHQAQMRKINLQTAQTRLKIAEAAANKAAAGGAKSNSEFEVSKQANALATRILANEMQSRTTEWAPGELEARYQGLVDMFKKQFPASSAAPAAPGAGDPLGIR